MFYSIAPLLEHLSMKQQVFERVFWNCWTLDLEMLTLDRDFPIPKCLLKDGLTGLHVQKVYTSLSTS